MSRIIQTQTANCFGSARFADILKNCVAHQVLWKTCSLVFLAFTLKLPIQTLLSVVPKCSVFWHATQFQQN